MKRTFPPLVLALGLLPGDRRCAPDLPAGALAVSATVTPHRVSWARPSDSLVVAISVRNPRPWPVDVHVGGPPYSMTQAIDSTSGIGFGYRILSRTGRVTGPSSGTWGRPVFRFGALQTLIDTIVVHIGPHPRGPGRTPRDGLAPGPYVVQAHFARTKAAPVPIEVVP
jgi:hypothetical protein